MGWIPGNGTTEICYYGFWLGPFLLKIVVKKHKKCDLNYYISHGGVGDRGSTK